MKSLLIYAAIFLSVPMGLAPARPAHSDGQFQEYEIKATFLIHLIKFVNWPETSQNLKSFELCVVGEDPFGSVLDYYKGIVIRGRKIVVTRLNEKSPINTCDLAFLGITDKREEQSWLTRARLAHVLTVGESNKFTRNGGVVRFVVDEDRVRLEINSTAAKASGISISTKLMNLVEVVHYPVEGGP
jgi:hypothetical protein